MIPCKKCVTEAICKNRVFADKINFDQSGYDHYESLTEAMKKAHKLCNPIQDYFPFIETNEGKIMYPDNCGIEEEEWEERMIDIYDFFFDK